jgi:hypothetical protein
VHLFQQDHDSDALQNVEELIHHRPFIQAGDPIDLLLAVQAPCDARVVAPSDLPTPPFCQVLCALVVCLSLDSSPSAPRPSLQRKMSQRSSHALVSESQQVLKVSIDNYLARSHNPVALIRQGHEGPWSAHFPTPDANSSRFAHFFDGSQHLSNM